MTQELAHTIKKFKIPLLLALNSHFLKVYQAMKPLSRSSKMKQILEKSALWHCYRKKAATVGQNGRLSASCNFFSFWLIKLWGTTNQISDHAALTDELSYHNFISKIWRPIIKSEHLWVCNKIKCLTSHDLNLNPFFTVS